MREIRPSGSEGGVALTTPSLPLSSFTDPSGPLPGPCLSPGYAHRYLTGVPLQSLQRYYGEVPVCIGRGCGAVPIVVRFGTTTPVGTTTYGSGTHHGSEGST